MLGEQVGKKVIDVGPDGKLERKGATNMARGDMEAPWDSYVLKYIITWEAPTASAQTLLA